MTSISWNQISDSLSSSLSIPRNLNELSIVKAALAYAECGWYVVPVKDGTKHPGSVLGSRWQDQSTRDEKEIRTLFNLPNVSIALHAGKSGALIIDVDNSHCLPEFLRLEILREDVPFQSTRMFGDKLRGHYFFRLPMGMSFGNGLGSIPSGWGDIRCHNGVVMASPSVHPEQYGLYKWQRTGAMPLLPTSIALKLKIQTSEASSALDDLAASEFITNNTKALYPELLSQRLQLIEKSPPYPGTRHTKFQAFLCLVMKDAKSGLYSANDALNQTFALFNKYKPDQKPKEFISMVLWAMGQVNEISEGEKDLHINATAPHLNASLMRWVNSHG